MYVTDNSIILTNESYYFFNVYASIFLILVNREKIDIIYCLFSTVFDIVHNIVSYNIIQY